MLFIIGLMALIIASAFTGAAIYINLVEHPARMKLDDRSALAQWKPAYKAGFVMQASLAMIGAVLGGWVAWVTQSPFWWAGAFVLFVNWPYTLIAIRPVNNKLMKMETPAPETRTLLNDWSALHGGRSILGAFATLLYAIALLALFVTLRR